MAYNLDTNEGDLAGRCGGCGSRTLTISARTDTLYAVCGDCGRFQELETRDWPVTKMCDNCAFRKGSPERADPDRWFDLMIETIERERPFHCHKGLAATLDKETQTVSFAEPPEGQRTVCAGWMAAITAKYRREERAEARETAE